MSSASRTGSLLFLVRKRFRYVDEIACVEGLFDADINICDVNFKIEDKEITILTLGTLYSCSTHSVLFKLTNVYLYSNSH